MKIIFYLPLLLSLAAYTQEIRQVRFLDRENRQPIPDIILRHIGTKNDTIAIFTDSSGKINIDVAFFPFTTSHINYKDTIVSAFNDLILLTPNREMLKNVLIEKKKKNEGNVALLAAAGLFYKCKSNLSHNSKAALFIHYDPKKQNKSINTLKYNVIDIFGVKNLKYLPFRASLYSVDTLTGLPGERIFDAGIITKQDNKKWVKVDIASQNIRVPHEGLFIVFEILGIQDYKIRTIWSKEGLIDAVPALNSKVSTMENLRKSYMYGSCTIDMDCGGEFQWQPRQCQYDMDVEYEK